MSSADTSIALQCLKETDAAMLRQLWIEARGSAPPRTFTARLMRQALAWDAQATLSGGEAAGTRRAWSRIIRARTDSRFPKSCRGAVPATVGDGTRILKDWGGKMHEVLLRADGGATWNGQPRLLSFGELRFWRL